MANDYEENKDDEPVNLQDEVLPFGEDSIPQHEIKFCEADGVVFVSCRDVADLLVMVDPDDANWYSKLQDLAYQLENIQLN